MRKRNEVSNVMQSEVRLTNSEEIVCSVCNNSGMCMRQCDKRARGGP